MKKTLIIIIFLYSTFLFSLELEDFYDYIGDYASTYGFRYEWYKDELMKAGEGFVTLLENGVFEKYTILDSSEFAIYKKLSNRGGFRLEIRENDSFICNLSESSMEYMESETKVYFIEEHDYNNRLIFLPNRMIVSESMIEDENLPDGVREYQYVIYKKKD